MFSIGCITYIDKKTIGLIFAGKNSVTSNKKYCLANSLPFKDFCFALHLPCAENNLRKGRIKEN